MKQIAVIGSINMDLTATADKLPMRGETIQADSFAYVPGGKGANQAVAASRLGGKVAMYGCVGDDVYGTLLVENLENEYVDTSAVEVLSIVSSGMAMIVVANGDNMITTIPGANAWVTPAYIDRHYYDIARADIVLIQNEIPMDTVRYAVKKLARDGKTIIYNPAPARIVDREILDAVSYITPNMYEVRTILDDPDTPPEDLVRQMQGKLIVTLGSHGLIAYADGDLVMLPALPATAVDTTGASDTLNGGLAYGLAADMPFKAALTFANIAAGLSIEQPGAEGGMPRLIDVLERMDALSE